MKERKQEKRAEERKMKTTTEWRKSQRKKMK